MQRIEQSDAHYPAVLRDRLGNAAPRCLYTLGDVAILHKLHKLHKRLLGLVCSNSYPGSIVIKTFDMIRELRDAGVVVVGGFHSPMERQCLDILLRGSQPVVLCAAKGLPGLRLGTETRRAVTENRLLVFSPFDQEIRRTTAIQAVQRNDLVTALADVVWVPHAVPQGKTWATVCRVLQRAQRVFMVADKENSRLIELGAHPFATHEITDYATADRNSLDG